MAIAAMQGGCALRRLPPDALRLIADEVRRRCGCAKLAQLLRALCSDRVLAPFAIFHARSLGHRWNWTAGEFVLAKLAEARCCAACGAPLEPRDHYPRPGVRAELGIGDSVHACNDGCWDALFPGVFEDPPPCTCPEPDPFPCPHCCEGFVSGDSQLTRLPPAVRRSYVEFAAPLVRPLRAMLAENSAYAAVYVVRMLLALAGMYPRRPGETDSQLVARYGQSIVTYVRTIDESSAFKKTRCLELARQHGILKE